MHSNYSWALSAIPLLTFPIYGNTNKGKVNLWLAGACINVIAYPEEQEWFISSFSSCSIYSGNSTQSQVKEKKMYSFTHIPVLYSEEHTLWLHNLKTLKIQAEILKYTQHTVNTQRGKAHTNLEQVPGEQ